MNDFTIEQLIAPLFILWVLAAFAFVTLRGLARHVIWIVTHWNDDRG